MNNSSLVPYTHTHTVELVCDHNRAAPHTDNLKSYCDVSAQYKKLQPVRRAQVHSQAHSAAQAHSSACKVPHHKQTTTTPQSVYVCLPQQYAPICAPICAPLCAPICVPGYAFGCDPVYTPYNLAARVCASPAQHAHTLKHRKPHTHVYPHTHVDPHSTLFPSPHSGGC